ncbi:putative proton-dependent oligopeptide transporter family, MFS transporter superfamily [Helianthus anomalus]
MFACRRRLLCVGVILLWMFNPYDVTWLIVIVLVLLALGKSGDTLLENVLTDLVYEVDRSEDRNKKRAHARAAFWRRVAHASGAISATMWVAPYALGGTNTTWNISFLTCLMSMIVTLMIFCTGHNVYYQGKLIHRPIEIFFRVIRARIQKLLKSKPRYSTQERSPERELENEGIKCERSPQDHGDKVYKEDVKVIQSLLRIFPLWGTFLVISIISSAGNTFYYEQIDSLEYSYSVPGQIYFVIQEISCFTVPILYHWTCFRHNHKLQIGAGMLCSILSCVCAWQLEVNMLKEIENQDNGDDEYVGTPISFLWFVPQFAMLGCMEGLTQKGLLKFFRSQVDKPIQNYGEEYMEIVMFLGQLINIGLVLILRFKFKWFIEGTNDETKLDTYYLVLVCVCLVNLIIYCCVAIWFYKDMKQDHSSSHHDLT